MSGRGNRSKPLVVGLSLALGTGAIALGAGPILAGPAAAAGNILFAQPGGPVAGSTCTMATPCSLPQALAMAAAGDTIELTSAGPYLTTSAATAAAFSVNVANSAADPITIEPAVGVVDPALDGGNMTQVLNVATGSGLTLDAVTVEHGFADGTPPTFSDVGGITSDGTLTLNHSTVADNVGSNLSDGGIFSSGTLTLNDSTVSGNRASGQDTTAGIQSSGTLNINDSTVADNRDSNAVSIGGVLNNGSLAATGSTFAGNSPSDVIDLGATSTTFAGNVFADGCASDTSSPLVTDLGFNADVDGSCTSPTSAQGDLRVDANLPSQLGPLASNGGPTQTIALLAGNLAISRIPNGTMVAVGNSAVTLCPATDQRGASSTPGAPCDLGSLQDAGQTISFTTTAPANAVVNGATYTPTATASSGLTVSLSIDPSSTQVCSMSGGVVSFVGPGTCTIDADQAGLSDQSTGDVIVEAAPQMQQAIPVGTPPAIGGTTATTFTVGQPGTFTLTVSGSPSPSLAESVSRPGGGASTLPAGLSFTQANGMLTLSGTPGSGTGGIYDITITAQSFAGTATSNVTLTVDEAPAIVTTTNPTFTAGESGGATVIASGFPAPALAETGAFPAGLSFEDKGNGTATLSGTPAAGTGGTYLMTVTASNGTGSDATRQFVVTVEQSPNLTGPSAAIFTAGETTPFTVTASGFPHPTLTTSGKLPAGLSFHDNGDGTATIAGAPLKGVHGTFPVTIAATNAAGTTTQALSVKVLSVGYNLVGADGGVFVFAPPGTGATGGFHGSLPGQHIHVTDIVGMVGSANGSGYALVGRDGGVFNFGHGAPFHGSLPGEKITVNNIVGIALDAGGQGYLMTSSTGVVYGHFGNTTGIPATGTAPVTTAANPVTGIAVTPDGTGYWLVEKNGHVVAAGSAKSFGSAATTSAVSIVATADAKGYWITSATGQVLALGDALKLPDLVSTHQHPSGPIVALVTTADQKGYLLIGTDGNVYAFGDALLNGSLPAIKVVPVLPVVGGVLTVG